MNNQEKPTALIVTHTHWDREWRYPLWENRYYLVALMDELLETLDNDPEYKNILLDGQSVIIDDYLEVRPQNREKIQQYIRDGRISIGPWYTLPDLYPLRGESLVRNLLKGSRVADGYGKCLKVAYESFGWGQTAQFPQIYKGFEMDVSIVAKHVSKERAPHSEFIWQSPDGTKILATRLGEHARANFFMNAYIKIMTGIDYLSDDFSYNRAEKGIYYHQADDNGFWEDYHKLLNTEQIHEAHLTDAFEKAWEATNETLLPDFRALMNGSDSTTTQPVISKLVKRLNQKITDRNIQLSSLEEYTDILQQKLDKSILKTVQGELRDGPAYACSANALMTRPHLKISNKKAEVALFHIAEPLSVAATLLDREYETRFLHKALDYLLLSHPHDSINGVTQDKTVNDVEYMLDQTLEIANVVANQTLSHIVKNINTSQFKDTQEFLVVFNPLPVQRKEILKATIDFPREKNVWDFEILGPDNKPLDKQLLSRTEETAPVNDLHSRPWPYYIDRHSVYFDSGNIPAGGYKLFQVRPVDTFNRKTVFWPKMRTSQGNEIGKSANILENQYIEVTIQGNGSATIRNKKTGAIFTNLNYFEDTGDCGDYWIYYPPYRNKTVLSTGCAAHIMMTENGPLSATVAAEITMPLPERYIETGNTFRGEGHRSDNLVNTIIRVEYTLRKGAHALEVKTVVDNNADDHRLRLLFDTGINTETIASGGHFYIDKRPVQPNANTEYYPEMQTLPHQGFVHLQDKNQGFAVISNCFIEYEALKNSRSTLAMTLLRGVRNKICTEFRSAGNFPHQHGGQSFGQHTFEYQILTISEETRSHELYEHVNQQAVPVKIGQTNDHQGELEPVMRLYEISPPEIQLSALKKSEDNENYIVRVFNPVDKEISGKISFHKKIVQAWITNLNENRTGEAELNDQGDICFVTGPHQILTIEFTWKP
ncbi:MAG: alpha-mannosidase [Bacteroidetes bacterium]|jgi:mannosylglycerate hydrolase|nr:alpha-mannosidase [Bacteroidota bacterium]